MNNDFKNTFNNNNGEKPINRFFALSKSSPFRQRQRPTNLFSSQNMNHINNNLENSTNRLSSSSSEEDNSPTNDNKMNNCRKFIDKAPLVKRLSNSLLRSGDEYRPLLNDNNFSSASNYLSASTAHITSKIDNITDDSLCDADELIASKFGDSCRKSLTSVLLDNRRTKDYCEFDFKQNFLRETSSANSSPKMFAFSTKQKRIRGLSIFEQTELKDAPWFQIGVPREISLEVLRRKNPGEFLVRESSTKPGCFALSLRAPPPAPKVVHYLILRTPRGYKIKGCAKEFTSLKALITHHSVMPEQLPCPLALPRPKHLPTERRNLDDYEIYSSLSNFQNMMIPKLGDV
ncbi:uncharacterized protein LOC116338666 [Contarinia nasturtii]|uniref:uncharacterized protein LOC116338666 n=1 Tax=Contarinia nasturtii TaxID=265458 RepID=UPI0012D3C2A8|nr:uncharacterized protein LOC116338666 [Contarinia nasturtii]